MITSRVMAQKRGAGTTRRTYSGRSESRWRWQGCLPRMAAPMESAPGSHRTASEQTIVSAKDDERVMEGNAYAQHAPHVLISPRHGRRPRVSEKSPITPHIGNTQETEEDGYQIAAAELGAWHMDRSEQCQAHGDGSRHQHQGFEG